MFGSFSQLPTTAKHCSVVGMLNDMITTHSLSSSQKLGGAIAHFIEGRKNTFVGWALNFGVHMLLKSTIKHTRCMLIKGRWWCNWTTRGRQGRRRGRLPWTEWSSSLDTCPVWAEVEIPSTKVKKPWTSICKMKLGKAKNWLPIEI